MRPLGALIILQCFFGINMTKQNKSIFDHLENQELIQKLIDNGFQKLVDAFLLNDSKVYTKKGRLNKSGACRVLKCKPKELEDAIKACQQLLSRDLKPDLDDEDVGTEEKSE